MSWEYRTIRQLKTNDPSMKAEEQQMYQDGKPVRGAIRIVTTKLNTECTLHVVGIAVLNEHPIRPSQE